MGCLFIVEGQPFLFSEVVSSAIGHSDPKQKSHPNGWL